MVRTTGVGLREEKDGGGDPGVGFEHARGHRDDGVELLLLDQDRAHGSMRLGRSEENAVGHDDGGPTAGLEQAEEEREEQQLGLLGLDDLLKVLGGGLVVEASRERRIGEDQGVCLRAIVVRLGQRIPVADVWVLQTVQQHIHTADAQHGVVEVVAVERALVKVAARRGVLVDGVAL